MRQKKYGFTLIELLCAIAIIGILGLFSMPLWQNDIQSTDVAIVQAKILQAIELAQQASRKGDAPVALFVNEQGDSLQVFWDEHNDGIIHDKKKQIDAVSVKKARIFLRSYPVYRKYILFAPADFYQNDNGSLWYCKLNDTRPLWAIMLSQSGRVSLVYPNRHGFIRDVHGKVLFC